MVLPLIPIAIGAAMAAGGTGAAAKGFSTKGTRPNPSYYGGSQGALDAQRDLYARQQRDNGRLIDSGAQGLGQIGNWGMAQANQAEGSINGAFANEQAARQQQALLAGNITNAAAAYQPGGQSIATYKAALADAANQNMALARSGTNSAMGLRDALNANAQASVDIGQRAALIRAQEEQAKAQLGIQANAAAGQMMGDVRAGDQSLAGMNIGRQQFGVQTAGGVYSGLSNLGAGREATYLDAQSQMEQAQLAAQMDYDRRRQEDRLQKRSQLIGLGAGLISGGANVMASSGGGYGRGGGGGGK